MDIHEYDKRVKQVLLKMDELRKEDKENILNFKKQLVVDNISSGRIMKYLYTLKALSNMNCKPFRECSKEDITNLVEKVQQADYTDWTKSDFKKISRDIARKIMLISLEIQAKTFCRL